jgi:hypothetical protein
LQGPKPKYQDIRDEILPPNNSALSEPIPHIVEPSSVTTLPASFTASVSPARRSSLSDRLHMSVYSTSSADTELSEFSNPPARRYREPNVQKMSRKITAVCHASVLGLLRNVDADGG